MKGEAAASIPVPLPHPASNVGSELAIQTRIADLDAAESNISVLLRCAFYNSSRYQACNVYAHVAYC